MCSEHCSEHFLEMRYSRARCAITHTRWTRDLNYYKVTALAALLFGAHKTGQQTIVYAVRWGRRLCIQLISQHWKSIVNNCPMCAHQITQDIPYNAISKLFFCCLIRHVFFLNVLASSAYTIKCLKGPGKPFTIGEPDLQICNEMSQ